MTWDEAASLALGAFGAGILVGFFTAAAIFIHYGSRPSRRRG